MYSRDYAPDKPVSGIYIATESELEDAVCYSSILHWIEGKPFNPLSLYRCYTLEDLRCRFLTELQGNVVYPKDDPEELWVITGFRMFHDGPRLVLGSGDEEECYRSLTVEEALEDWKFDDGGEPLGVALKWTGEVENY